MTNFDKLTAPDVHELALLKRQAERRLLSRGWSRRAACHEVSRLSPDELRRTARITVMDRLRGRA